MSIGFVNLNIILSVLYQGTYWVIQCNNQIPIAFKVYVTNNTEKSMCLEMSEMHYHLFQQKALKEGRQHERPFLPLAKEYTDFQSLLGLYQDSTNEPMYIYTSCLHFCYIEKDSSFLPRPKEKIYSRKITEGHPPVMVAITTRGHCPIPVPCP